MRRLRGVGVYLAAITAWSALVLILVWFLGPTKATDAIGVAAGPRLFGDMRLMTDGFDAANRGEEVRWSQYQPRDYPPMRFPYHRSWLGLRHLGITSDVNNAMAITLIVATLTHFAVLTAVTGNTVATGLALAAFAASPFMMLGFERGNPDLFAYVLLAAGCHLLARSTVPTLTLGAAFVFFAGMLKFVPFAGLLGVLPGDQSRRRQWAFVAVMAATLLFMAIEAEDVVRVATAPIVSTNWMSFGASISALDLQRGAIKLLGLPPTGTARVAIQGVGMLAVLAVIWGWSARLARHGESIAAVQGVAASGFALGSGIFIASFLLIRSYNYKIMFLAPAIPALIIWARRADAPGHAARVGVTTLLVWIWSGLNAYVQVAMNAVLPWLTVAALGALLLAMLSGPLAALPDRFRQSR